MKPRRLFIAAALLCAALALAAFGRMREEVPGLSGHGRTLLRIWITGSPGGGQAWLTEQLRAFSRQHPGVMTRVRIVAPQELTARDTVLPDVVLFMPGDVTDPSALFTPLGGEWPLREPLIAAGRMDGVQYAIPLCWGGWTLAIDSALDPVPAATPAPTTLLGRPAATSAPTESPGYPLQAASAADVPLLSPGGAALLALSNLLPADSRPPLPEDFAHLSPAEVYAAFRERRCATAMLTTGQIAAFSALTSAGKGFPFRVLVPDQVATDQLMMAAVTADAPPQAGALLRFLVGDPAQQALTSQALHTVRDDLTLYAAGVPGEVEQAAQRQLRAANAFLPREEAHALAWQAFTGAIPPQQALP